MWDIHRAKQAYTSTSSQVPIRLNFGSSSRRRPLRTRGTAPFLEATWNVKVALLSSFCGWGWGQSPQSRSSSCRHTSNCAGERTAKSREEKLLAKTRIRDSFSEFRRVDSKTTRLLIVGVSLSAPSNVMLRSFEHLPISRQKEVDTTQPKYI